MVPIQRRLTHRARGRLREYLTPDEVERLLEGAKQHGRYPCRDAALILLSYRHGFRVSELVALRWHQIDLLGQQIHVLRAKRGSPSVHPLRRAEMQALHSLAILTRGEYVFLSERGKPLSRRTVHAIVARAGRTAGFSFPVHPHMLRHACGYKLANDGQDTRAIQAYLGHKNIQHTVRYTELSAERFKDFWND